jgi:hypothetical protein
MKYPAKRSNARVVRSLSCQATQAAAGAPDPLADLSAAIKIAMQSEADPYVMLGVLLEGMTQTMVTRIPPERHHGTLSATLVVLRQRVLNDAARPTSRTFTDSAVQGAGGETGSSGRACPDATSSSTASAAVLIKAAETSTSRCTRTGPALARVRMARAYIETIFSPRPEKRR